MILLKDESFKCQVRKANYKINGIITHLKNKLVRYAFICTSCRDHNNQCAFDVLAN